MTSTWRNNMNNLLPGCKWAVVCFHFIYVMCTNECVPCAPIFTRNIAFEWSFTSTLHSNLNFFYQKCLLRSVSEYLCVNLIQQQKKKTNQQHALRNPFIHFNRMNAKSAKLLQWWHTLSTLYAYIYMCAIAHHN